MEWITQAEFAKRQGVSRMAISKAIAAGRLRTNGKQGRECRIDSTCSLAATRSQKPVNLHKAPESEEAVSQPLSLWQAAKVKKLAIDIETAKLRNEELYKQMLRQVSEKQFEIFIQHFAPVREALIQLRLPADQIDRLKQIFSEALNGYKQAVAAWNETL